MTTYHSKTHGHIPLSQRGKNLLKAMRDRTVEAINARFFALDNFALSRARAEVVLYMSELEKDLSRATACNYALTRQLSVAEAEAAALRPRGRSKTAHIMDEMRRFQGKWGRNGPPMARSYRVVGVDTVNEPRGMTHRLEILRIREAPGFQEIEVRLPVADKVTPFTNTNIEAAKPKPRKMVWGDINPSRGVTFDEINPYFRTAYPSRDIYAEAIDQMVATGLANKSRIHRAMLAPYCQWNLERRAVPSASADRVEWYNRYAGQLDRRSGGDRRGPKKPKAYLIGRRVGPRRKS